MTETKKNIQLGHQAPKGFRINECNSIEINGDFAYCISHNFVYNAEDEERKLYDGEACYYTDARFYDGFYNFYKNCYLRWRRREPFSIKSAVRRTLKCKGIPVGTIVSFKKSYYHVGKSFSNGYVFKIKKENPIDFKFEVNAPSYSKNFTTCKRSQKLVDALRANGFIVSVREDNDNFISSMVSTAAAHMGEELEVHKEKGEVAIAYGHGKKIGISSGDNNLYGYSNACDSVLWDRHNWFNKWSQCNEIPKTTSVDEIVKILIKPNPPEDE